MHSYIPHPSPTLLAAVMTSLLTWGLQAEPKKQLWPSGPQDNANANATAAIPKGTAKVSGQLVFPSPDGRFAISKLNRAEALKPGMEVKNHLVDLQTGNSIHVIATDEHGISDFEGKNHGGLNALWRADSRAVLVRFEGKWDPRAVWLLVISKDGTIEAAELTSLVRPELVKIFEKQATKLWEKGHEFAANLGCEFSPDGKTLNLMADGETNAKMILGSAHIVAELSGKFDLAARTLTVTSSKVTEAKIVKDE